MGGQQHEAEIKKDEATKQETETVVATETETQPEPELAKDATGGTGTTGV